ncbi:MAG: DUF192 domain-containing protein, partial [Pseudomonadota bacterium]
MSSANGAFMIRAVCAFLLAAFVMVVNVHAQPAPDPNAVFPVETLAVKTSAGEFTFTIEVADEDAERQRGLMFRQAMLPTHGMLFEFQKTQVIYMWMENTVLPLDMIFIRSDGSVARVEENTTPFSRRIIASGEPVSHVLELNAGMVRQIALKPDDIILHRF